MCPHKIHINLYFIGDVKESLEKQEPPQLSNGTLEWPCTPIALENDLWTTQTIFL